MLTIIGTVPDETFPLVVCEAALDGAHLVLDQRRVPVNRGTPALLAASVMASRVMGGPMPLAILAGDTGRGTGSRDIYAYLTAHLAAHLAAHKGEDAAHTLVFHYLQPDVDWHDRVLFAVGQCASRPVLIADAGYMYAAKMSGQAGEYDLFTPDVGELAFLADEMAPHPFYTRGFLLQEEFRVPEYIRRAYAHGDSARFLLVKGRDDHFADDSGILATVREPLCPELEAVGGTGDTLTGIVAALIQAGLTIERAALVAAKANRLAGLRSAPTPATQVMEIAGHIPAALREALAQIPDNAP